MINVKEIMIGGCFLHNESWSYRNEEIKKDFIFQWEGRDWYALGECTLSLDDVSPIPLTTEILEICGFNWSIYHQAFHKEGFELDINECYPKGYALCEFKKSKTVVPNIVFLHQLQNAYYVLTGSELDATGLLNKKEA